MWINVNERLPKQGEVVLAAVGAGKKLPQRLAVVRACFPEPGIHDDDEFGWFDVDGKDYVLPITHWQPLPEPPQASGERGD